MDIDTSQLSIDNGYGDWSGYPLPTPIGTAVFPHLHAPDTKFDKDGHWKTGLRTDDEEFIAMLDELHEASHQLFLEEAMSKAKGSKAARKKKAEKKIQKGPPPYKEELDDETGEETGFYLVGDFKMKVAGTRDDGSRWNRKPIMFDSVKQPLKVGLKIGGGSRIRLAFKPNPYWMSGRGTGVSLRLEAVQLIELETWGGRDADDFGFGEAEGFTAEDADDEDYAGDDDSPDEFSDDDGDYDIDDEADF